jgi:hypothetical protein
MNYEPWINALAGSLFGLIIGSVFGSWIQRMLYRPKVHIEVTHESPYEHEGGFFVSVAVTNKGENAATDCLGSITFIDLSRKSLLNPKDAVSREHLPVEAEEQLLTPDNFREIDREVLCWAHIGNPDKFTVNPGMKTLLDVFKAIYSKETAQWYLAIPTETGWKKLRTRLKDGHYRGKILVSPSNGKPSIKKFQILSSKESDENKPKLELV